MRRGAHLTKASAAFDDHANGNHDQAHDHDGRSHHIGQYPDIRAGYMAERIQKEQEQDVGKRHQRQRHSYQADGILIELFADRRMGAIRIDFLRFRRHLKTSVWGSEKEPPEIITTKPWHTLYYSFGCIGVTSG